MRLSRTCCFFPAEVVHKASFVRSPELTGAADAWARANVDVARKALAVPPLRAKLSSPLVDFEAYVACRKFELPAQAEERQFALLLLRHLLTYPLTLAAAVKAAGIASNVTTRAAVVGARAESSLPATVWAEVAIASAFPWEILALGPQVVPSRRLNASVSTGDVELACRRRTLTAADDLRDICAEAFADDDLVEKKNVDVVALFHPGLGHEKHAAGWRGGLTAIFKAEPRAIVITSFSARDQASDLAALDTFFKETGYDADVLVEPRLNAFPSGRAIVDPLDKTHIITPNERLMVLGVSPFHKGRRR